MTIKDTIKSMIIMCPRLFSTKLSVYNHLFLTIGNGYRWENGELISEDDKVIIYRNQYINELSEIQYKIL